MEKALARYGVTHRTSTTYHPQTNGQVENAYRGAKKILEKTVGASRKDWSEKLDDVLWTVNIDLTEAARKGYFQIHELEELRDVAYSRSLNIKEKTKSLHDRRLKGSKEFKKGDKILLPIPFVYEKKELLIVEHVQKWRALMEEDFSIILHSHTTS
ncbi:uncharacterized protein LOC143533839 [Bidens hawaiensis]|uniref:uncharacterized protein LOC143533839 n=1 Tax=Bidens hawaiensis TaxID=980011 RepID=UPI004049306A